MNLKDILNPKTCEECKFLYDSHLCKLSVWSVFSSFTYVGFDPDTMIHKDCPLPRIKCENCKHREILETDIGKYKYCTVCDRIDTEVPCIEFEEVR